MNNPLRTALFLQGHSDENWSKGICKEQNMAPAENLGLEVSIESLKMWLHMFRMHNVKTSAVPHLILKKACLTGHEEQEAEVASS